MQSAERVIRGDAAARPQDFATTRAWEGGAGKTYVALPTLKPKESRS